MSGGLDAILDFLAKNEAQVIMHEGKMEGLMQDIRMLIWAQDWDIENQAEGQNSAEFQTQLTMLMAQKSSNNQIALLLGDINMMSYVMNMVQFSQHFHDAVQITSQWITSNNNVYFGVCDNCNYNK